MVLETFLDVSKQSPKISQILIILFPNFFNPIQTKVRNVAESVIAIKI
jgi:hypothetical protein